jgi:hypothetical protein
MLSFDKFRDRNLSGKNTGRNGIIMDDYIGTASQNESRLKLLFYFLKDGFSMKRFLNEHIFI